MARLCPSLLPRVAMSAGEHAELALLETLERGLSSAYTLFHSVDWAMASGTQEAHGEIDIVVVNQAGDVLLIEVKAGDVDIRPEGIFKSYAGRAPKDVGAQVRLQYGALRTRLQDEGLGEVSLRNLLVLPDVRVTTHTAQWPGERIVDALDVDNLVSTVTQLLGPGQERAKTLQRVLAFFENRFRVEPDVSVMAGRVKQAATRLASGLATWVPRIQAPSGVIRVMGTAGSGKTQLALRLLRDADARGQKAAYLCFNRALADHMARVAPVRTPAETFHECALRMARRAGAEVDFAEAAAFGRVAQLGVETMTAAAPDLNLIVLDEVQDLQPEWVEALLSRLRDDGRAVLLEDPAQQLYSDRVTFEVADAVTVTSRENFRSPRALVRLINALRLTDHEVEALSPLEGELPDPIVYDSLQALQRRTAEAVQRCLKRGFAVEDVAVISLRGREGSSLQGLDRLGNWSLKRFSGRYDDGGAAIWTEGQLLIDSVRRFKGQAAEAVVLTECDLDELDDLRRRLLFVGITRARMHLEWVVSQRTADLIGQILGREG